MKFMCKVSGHPRPRLTWWVNGTIIVNVSHVTALMAACRLIVVIFCFDACQLSLQLHVRCQFKPVKL